jgi:hypothetical protein
MEKKKLYTAPSIRKVRLDIKESVLGDCFSSANPTPAPICQTPTITCVIPG